MSDVCLGAAKVLQRGSTAVVAVSASPGSSDGGGSDGGDARVAHGTSFNLGRRCG